MRGAVNLNPARIAPLLPSSVMLSHDTFSRKREKEGSPYDFASQGSVRAGQGAFFSA